jgi:hypothetical protein
MTLLPLVLSLCIPFVCASLATSNGTSIPTLDVSDCPSCGNTRSLSDIIWSCAATLFACTWTAIHPNIPGLDDRKVAIMSRRALLMVMALVVPELVIIWAARQFSSARRTADKFNEKLSKELAQADGDHRKIGEESRFTGWLLIYALNLRPAVTNFRMDSDAWVLRLDGWIPTLRRWPPASNSYTR